MPSQGTVITRVYTSDAYIPLPGARVVFTQTDQNGNEGLLTVKVTDRSGLTEPLTINTPDATESLTPDNVVRPFATVNIRVSYPNYSSIKAEGVQIFPGVETIQGLRLYPVTQSDQTQSITIPAETQPL